MINGKVFMWSNLAATEAAKYDTIGDIEKMCEPLQRAVGYSKAQAVRYAVFALCEWYDVKYEKTGDVEELVRELRSTDAAGVRELGPVLMLGRNVLAVDFVDFQQLPGNMEAIVSQLHEAVISALQYLSTQHAYDEVLATDLIKYYKLLYRM